MADGLPTGPPDGWEPRHGPVVSELGGLLGGEPNRALLGCDVQAVAGLGLAPGDSNGDGVADLWARSTATSGTSLGQLREYPIGSSAAADGSTVVKVHASSTDGSAS